MLKGEINEKDIEKEALSSEQIEGVAGGAAQRAPARTVDMENKAPACLRVDMEQGSVNRVLLKDAPENRAALAEDNALFKDAPENK